MTTCEVQTSPSVAIEHSKLKTYELQTWFAEVIHDKPRGTWVKIGRTHSYSIVTLTHSITH